MGPTAKVVGSRLVASGGVASSGHPVDGSALVVAVCNHRSSVCLQGSSHSLRLGFGHVCGRVRGWLYTKKKEKKSQTKEETRSNSKHRYQTNPS